VWFINVFVRTR